MPRSSSSRTAHVACLYFGWLAGRAYTICVFVNFQHLCIRRHQPHYKKPGRYLEIARCCAQNRVYEKGCAKLSVMKPATSPPFCFNTGEHRGESSEQTFEDGIPGEGIRIPGMCAALPVEQAIHDQSLLPATYRTSDDELETPDAGNVDFLRKELNVDRLNAIHDWLFVVGRPMPPRPLHHQRVMQREIIVTERPDLHLVWAAGRIFIKPLPRYLFDTSFWRQNLLCKPHCVCNHGHGDAYDPRICEQQALFQCANGLLYSYASLICHESDYHIARYHHLIPECLTWPTWVALVSQLLDPASPHRCRINRRYVYGELRLSRLNDVYRFRKGHFIRGYLYNYKYDKYMSFLRLNLGRIFALGAYMVIILNAMQVGLSTQRLAGNETFQRACYGFVALALLGPLILLVAAIVTFFVIMLWNLLVTRNLHKKRSRKPEK